MKSIVRFLAVAALSLVALCSCGDNKNNETVTEQALPGFFAIVDDLSNNATAVYSGLSYSVRLNYDKMEATVQISGLKLPDGTSYPTMTLPGLTWNVDKQGWRVIKGSAVTPSITGFATTPLFTNFELKLYDRVFDFSGTPVYSPGACVRYTIDSRYRVLSTFSPQVLYGETESVSASGKEFETEGVEYVVSYNADTRKLAISMNNARFEQGMPMALNIDLKNIDVTVTGSSLEFNVPSITPSIGDIPFTAFPITNLRGSFAPGDGLKFSFRCAPRTTEETYDVTVDCGFNDLPSL